MEDYTIAWFEVKSEYVQLKFVSSLDYDTILNENFELTTDDSTPSVISEPFETIDKARDYSSISRILTLWWKNKPASGDYLLNVSNLANYRNEPVPDFVVDFTWVNDESAMPDSESTLEKATRPSRDPVDTEDYSIKSVNWTDISTSSNSADLSLEVDHVEPQVPIHYQVSAQENLGKIDIYFSLPIYSNFLSESYFTLSKKPVKKGIAQWVVMDAKVTVSNDSKVVSVYVPAVESESTSIYSDSLTSEELIEHNFFEAGYKYRLVLSSLIGA